MTLDLTGGVRVSRVSLAGRMGRRPFGDGATMTTIRVAMMLALILLGVASECDVMTKAERRAAAAAAANTGIPSPDAVAAAEVGGVQIVNDGERAILTLSFGTVVLDSLVEAEGTPPSKLAEGRLVFSPDSEFAGVAIDGFAVWFSEKKGLQFYASGPERQYGAGRRYAYLRSAAEHEEQGPESKDIVLGRRTRQARDTSAVDAALGLILSAAVTMFGGREKLREVVELKKQTAGTATPKAGGKADKTPAANSITV